MTIETQQGKKSWIGDGSTTNYPYSYPFLNASDIEVYLDGEKQASGFSVQNKTDYSTGANIIFDVAPAEGVLIVIRRNVPMTQEISYPENGEFPAKSHEKSLDKLTMLIIDNNKESLKVNPATPEDFNPAFPVPEANKALKITADGKGFTMSDYDPDTALALTEDFKNQAQQAAIDALSSQTAAANSETIATQQSQNATTQAANAKASADNAAELNQQLTNNFNAYSSSLQGDFSTYTNNLINTKENGMASLANASNALRQTQITNCLLEVPQKIKLELNDGTLTLKAGSQVIVPKGAGVFDEKTISSDITVSPNDGEKMFFLHPDGTRIYHANISNQIYSGTTQPSITYGFWYDTTNNDVKFTGNGSTWISGFSLPLAKGSNTSIDQVFNGIGYIGSTVWVDKGVKGLIPNGRNEDGTLRNIEYVTPNLITRNFTDNGSLELAISSSNTLTVYSYFTVSDENYLVGNNGNKVIGVSIANVYMTNNVITSFDPKQPFRAVDYSDKPTISGWSMPSSKYIDLTLGASGTEYMAPANGWFWFSGSWTNANGYVQLRSVQKLYRVQTPNNVSSGYHGLMLPITKGDSCMVAYNTTPANVYFRFIYAEGSK